MSKRPVGNPLQEYLIDRTKRTAYHGSIFQLNGKA
jgi:hypothetical protein